MADGKIKIEIEVDGKEVSVASRELDKLEESGLKSGKGVKAAEDGLKGVGEESAKASGSVKKFATSLGLVALGAVAFKTLRGSLDDAIKRFDTLNRFPKVLQALGVSAEDSERAMTNLADGIDGLPTLLNDIAANAQNMYSAFGDMDKATDMAIALNNSLLGSGSSAAEAQRGVEMYMKILNTGKVDMMTWNSLSNTMGVGLENLAAEFGYTGKSAKIDLYNALQDGRVPMNDFHNKLIEIGTGTGIMATLAKENSKGIATSLRNLRNSAARGIAGIIDSFDKLSQTVTGKDIAENIDNLKHIVNASFRVIGSTIERTTPIVISFTSGVKALIPVVQTLSPAIIGLTTAYGSYIVITKMAAAVKASNAVLTIATTSSKTLTLATQAQMASQIASTTATKADIVTRAAQTGTIKASTLAIGVMTGQISLATAATVVKTAATYALGAAWRFLLGPIGWAVAAIGLLVTAVIAIVKWFRRASEEGKRLSKETDELGDSVDSLNDSIESSSNAYKKNQSEIKNNAKVSEELVRKIDELSRKENKSAADKALLTSYVDELNRSVEDLNLVYGEESDALNMSSEQMRARIGLMKEQETAQAAQERLTAILREQQEVEEKLAESNALRDEWNQKLEDGSVKSREHKKAISELEEQEISLAETNQMLTEERIETEKQLIESIEAVTAATEKSTGSQMTLFEELSESQQAAVESMKSTWQDYQEQATEMFDRLSDESETSVKEMTKNLEENQRIITEWSDNIATLAERGVDEGLLETLRAAGPSSAGHVNALVNASDDELKKLSETFKKGAETATNAMSTAFGMEEHKVMEAVGHLITETEETLSEQIKNANFKSIASAIPEGVENAIEDGTKNVEKASSDMSRYAAYAFKQEAGINSPSKVFQGFGRNFTEGLVLGISQGTAKVLQAIQSMFRAIETDSSVSFTKITRNHDEAVKDIEVSLKKLPIAAQNAMREMLNRLKSGASDHVREMRNLARELLPPFNNTKSQFNSIGRNAMDGLNQGLLAGRARVMNTARNIANEVARTMQRELDIHSPSRVMKDKVGRWIPEGIALGIEEKASSIYKALNNIFDRTMLSSTPELALGTSRMAFSGAGDSVADALKSFKLPTSRTENTTINKQPAVINVFVGSKKISAEIVDDITNLQDRKKFRNRRAPKGGNAQ